MKNTAIFFCACVCAAGLFLVASGFTSTYRENLRLEEVIRSGQEELERGRRLTEQAVIQKDQCKVELELLLNSRQRLQTIALEAAQERDFLKERTGKLSAAVVALEREVDGKDSAIEKLLAENSIYFKRLKTLTSERDSSRTEAEKLRTDAERLRTEAGKLRAELAKRQDELKKEKSRPTPEAETIIIQEWIYRRGR